MKVCIKVALIYILKNYNKVRTACSCLGIVILFIVIVFNISNGMGNYLRLQYDELGESYIVMSAEYYSKEFVAYLNKEADMEINIAYELYDISKDAAIKAVVTNNEKINIMDSDYGSNILLEGRFFNDFERYHGDRCVLIDRQGADIIFPAGMALGNYIEFAGISYRVVGVVEGNENPYGIKESENANTVNIFIPSASFSESEMTGRRVTYHLSMNSKDIESVKCSIEEYMEQNDIEDFDMITSLEVNERISGIRDIFRNVLLGFSLFSIVIGALVMVNTIKLVIMDLYRNVLFFKIQGISDAIIGFLIFLIGEFVALIGVLGGMITGEVLVVIANYITGLSMYIKCHEMIILVGYSLAMSLLAFVINIKQLNQIKLISLFRN